MSLAAVSQEFQAIQAQTAAAVQARQRLEAQLSENELVRKEFAQLSSANTIYKQIGPVLVKQDPAEAKSNVDTRIDYIKGEIKRIEGQLKELESKAESKKAQIIELQQQNNEY